MRVGKIVGGLGFLWALCVVLAPFASSPARAGIGPSADPVQSAPILISEDARTCTGEAGPTAGEWQTSKDDLLFSTVEALPLLRHGGRLGGVSDVPLKASFFSRLHRPRSPPR